MATVFLSLFLLLLHSILVRFPAFSCLSLALSFSTVPLLCAADSFLTIIIPHHLHHDSLLLSVHGLTRKQIDSVIVKKIKHCELNKNSKSWTKLRLTHKTHKNSLNLKGAIKENWDKEIVSTLKTSSALPSISINQSFG